MLIALYFSSCDDLLLGFAVTCLFCKSKSILVEQKTKPEQVLISLAVKLGTNARLTER